MPYSAKFWWWKILENLVKLHQYAKIFYHQNFEIFVTHDCEDGVAKIFQTCSRSTE